MAMETRAAGGMPPSKIKLILCVLGVVVSLILLLAARPDAPKTNLIAPKTTPIAVFGDMDIKSPSIMTYAGRVAMAAKKAGAPAANPTTTQPSGGQPAAQSTDPNLIMVATQESADPHTPPPSSCDTHDSGRTKDRVCSGRSQNAGPGERSEAGATATVNLN